MQDEQPILCAEGEISTKNWNFECESTSWDLHVESWRNMFQSKIKYLSWVLDENVWMQSRICELVSWESNDRKVLMFWENMLWVEKTSESELKV
jgi:hypothetical protein